jgi:hypothetical protein
MRESTEEEAGHGDPEVQTRADRNLAAADRSVDWQAKTTPQACNEAGITVQTFYLSFAKTLCGPEFNSLRDFLSLMFC